MNNFNHSLGFLTRRNTIFIFSISKFCRDRDLYRVYGKSTKDAPIVLNVEADIAFLDAMSKFSLNYTLEDFMMVDLRHRKDSQSESGETSSSSSSFVTQPGVIITSYSFIYFYRNLEGNLCRRLLPK